MSERDKILARVREALKVSAPLPGHQGAGPTPAHTSGTAGQARQWLPSVGETFEEQLTVFQTKCAELKAAFHLFKSTAECAESLLELRDRERWRKIGVHKGELTDLLCARLGIPVCRTDKGYNVADLESCDAGLTECDALVAQTGSVLLTSQSAGGRALSVLPPHHVVLARRQQLVRDLPEAFALLKQKYGASYPSFISFISGPSRTGDIERILVLGAHGPKKLTICCV